MRFKRIIAFILLLFIPFAVMADELKEAFDTVYNGIYASVASFFSVPRITIEGLSFESNEENSQIQKVAFNRVDLARMLQCLKKENRTSTTWYEKLVAVASQSLSPIINLAVTQIEKSNYEVGDAIIDGSITLIYSEYYPFSSLLDLFVKNDWSDLSFSFTLSMIVSGNRFSQPLLFEGKFDVKGGQKQQVVVSCDNLEINHTRYEVTPLIFSN